MEFVDQKLLGRAARYCAMEEQCVSSVKKKLSEWGTDREMADLIVDYLVENKYIDEHRYVRSFCEGKIRLQRWGRCKVAYHLRQKGVSDALVSEGLAAVHQQEYEDILHHVAEAKWQSCKGNSEFERKRKLMAFLLSRGFESDLVRRVADEM